MKILKGKKAKQTLIYLLSTSMEDKNGIPLYQKRLAQNDNLIGYYKNNNIWEVFDNRSHDCWVENFKTEQECIDYLNN